MNTKTLIELLEIEKIPSRWYSINDKASIVGDTSVIKNVDDKYWEYFYFDDRGGKDDYVKFDSENNEDNESSACKYLLREMLRIKESYIKVGLQLKWLFMLLVVNFGTELHIYYTFVTHNVKKLTMLRTRVNVIFI